MFIGLYNLSFDLPNNYSFSVHDVYFGLSTLKGIKSVDPDGISGKCLYSSRYTIAIPLWLLFRRSLSEAVLSNL